MIVTLLTAGLQTLAQVRVFVEGNAFVSFTLTNRTAAYAWITDTLKCFRYARCGRADIAGHVWLGESLKCHIII
jgi:hypothetical protein